MTTKSVHIYCPHCGAYYRLTEEQYAKNETVKCICEWKLKFLFIKDKTIVTIIVSAEHDYQKEKTE